MSSPKTAPGPNPEQPLAGPSLKSAPERAKWRAKQRVMAIVAAGKCASHHMRNAVRGKTMCQECLDRKKVCGKARRNALRATGKCVGHPNAVSFPGSNRCITCILRNIKKGARTRSYTWGLSDAQVKHIIFQPCAYCGAVPSGGIDRRKNEYGYTVSNSIPCCWQCNRSKHTGSAKEFMEMCHAVSKHCIDRETFMARNAELQKQLKEFEQWQSESTSAEPAE